MSVPPVILGKVAKEIGKVYEKSGDETLAQLAQSYYTMKEEAQYLSKLVEKQLQQYDLKVLESSAILTDVPYEVCVGMCLITFCATNWFWCQILCGGLCYPCITGFWPSCPPCAVCIGIPALYCLLMCV